MQRVRKIFLGRRLPGEPAPKPRPRRLQIIFFAIIGLSLLATIPITIILFSSQSQPVKPPVAVDPQEPPPQEIREAPLFEFHPWKAARALDAYLPPISSHWNRLLPDPLETYRILVTCCYSDTFLSRLDISGQRSLVVTRFAHESPPLMRIRKKLNMLQWSLPDVPADYILDAGSSDNGLHWSGMITITSNGKNTLLHPLPQDTAPSASLLQSMMEPAVPGNQLRRQLEETAEEQLAGGVSGDRHEYFTEASGDTEEFDDTAEDVYEDVVDTEAAPRQLKTSANRLWRLMGGCGDEPRIALSLKPTKIMGKGWWQRFPRFEPRGRRVSSVESSSFSMDSEERTVDKEAEGSASDETSGLPPLSTDPSWSLLSPVFRTMGRFNVVVDRALGWMAKTARPAYAKYLISLLSPYSRILIEVFSSNTELRSACALFPESVTSKELRHLFHGFTITFLESNTISPPSNVPGAQVSRVVYLLVGGDTPPIRSLPWHSSEFSLYHHFMANDLERNLQDMEEEYVGAALPPTSYEQALLSHLHESKGNTRPANAWQETGVWEALHEQPSTESELLNGVIKESTSQLNHYPLPPDSSIDFSAAPPATWLWVNSGTANSRAAASKGDFPDFPDLEDVRKPGKTGDASNEDPSSRDRRRLHPMPLRQGPGLQRDWSDEESE